MITETITNITWEDFVELTDRKKLKNSDFIYRGQSNSFEFPNSFKEWDVTSSFNRLYSKKNLRFKQFLSQQLNENLFKTAYANYEFVKRTKLDKADLITRLYFLQHYGISTCLIDFTLNPLVALYFTLTSLKGHQFRSNNIDGFPSIYPNDCHVSIFQINYKVLSKILNINEIIHKSNDLFLQYEHYGKDISKNEWAYLGIDLFPHRKINPEIDNFNLKAQEGCFILYDNAETNKKDLISFLEEYCRINEIILDEPLIRIYKIGYNCLYKPIRQLQPNYTPVFKYLEKENITGRNLFNDYQGLKYDFNFFHEK